ncbi:MAG TPA: carboxypeptidase-like regulatory domain-containing protein, partial [Planctomycetota bacterium]|nr:carboxypeptidase-like regulatory domain-containing protein [Planctomycetota bacterium]
MGACGRMLCGVLAAGWLTTGAAGQDSRPPLIGRVVYADGGAPAAGATVEIFGRGRAGVRRDEGGAESRPTRRAPGGRGAPLATLVADDDGRFQAPEHAVGTMFVRAAKPGFAATFRQLRLPREGVETFVLQRAVALRGRVTDGDGAAVPGALVTLTQLEATTDADGAFEILDAPPDLEDAALMTRAPGFAAAVTNVPWPPVAPAEVVLERHHVLHVRVVDDD